MVFKIGINGLDASDGDIPRSFGKRRPRWGRERSGDAGVLAHLLRA